MGPAGISSKVFKEIHCLKCSAFTVSKVGEIFVLFYDYMLNTVYFSKKFIELFEHSLKM